MRPLNRKKDDNLCTCRGIFPNAVGCIDGTPNETYRRQIEPQRESYSGHRHCHLVNTQIIVDNLGTIVCLQAGFLGGKNDAANFLLMERFGSGTDHDMPVGTLLLADKGYADTPLLLTPFRKAQIRTLAIPDKRRARRFNLRLSRCRIVVEHTIKHLKTFYGFGLSLDTRDLNASVSRAKRTRCYVETATFPRANFVVWSMVIRLFTF